MIVAAASAWSVGLDYLKVLIAPAAAIIGALAGAWYGAVQQRRRDQDARTDERSRNVRDLVVELVQATQEWALGAMDLVEKRDLLLQGHPVDDYDRVLSEHNALQLRRIAVFSRLKLTVADGHVFDAMMELDRDTGSAGRTVSDVVFSQTHDAALVQLARAEFGRLGPKVNAFTEAVRPWLVDAVAN